MGYIIDLRKFATKRGAEDILIKDFMLSELLTDLIKKEIFNIEILFVNETFQSYNQELLVLVDSMTAPDANGVEEQFKLYGILMEDKFTGNDESLRVYKKDLISPFKKRDAHIIGFFRVEKSTSLIIFGDGVIWMLDSENNNGITKRFQLKFPFEKATSCLFEAE